jgi:hypothetical protein
MFSVEKVKNILCRSFRGNGVDWVHCGSHHNGNEITKVCVYDTGLIPRHSCEKLTELTWMVRISRFTCKIHDSEDAGKFEVQFFLCALLPYTKTVDIQLWVCFFKCSRNAFVSCKLQKSSSCVCSLAQSCTLGKLIPPQLGHLQLLSHPWTLWSEINLTMSSFCYQ